MHKKKLRKKIKIKSKRLVRLVVPTDVQRSRPRINVRSTSINHWHHGTSSEVICSTSTIFELVYHWLHMGWALRVGVIQYIMMIALLVATADASAITFFLFFSGLGLSILWPYVTVSLSLVTVWFVTCLFRTYCFGFFQKFQSTNAPRLDAFRGSASQVVKLCKDDTTQTFCQIRLVTNLLSKLFRSTK